MKSKKVTEAKTALQKKIKEILSDKKNANGVLDLLQILSDDQQESSVDPVSKARKLSALKGLVEIFTAWIKNGDTKVKKDSSGPSDQLASWILERLDEFWAAIAQCLSQDDDETLQEFALVGGFRLLQAGDPRWTQDSQKRLRTLVLSLCSSQRSRPKQIRRFQEFLEFLDVKQHTLTTLQKHVRHQTKKNSEATEPFKQNVMTFLEILGFSKLSEKQLASAKYLIPRPENDEEASFHFDYDTSRKAFSDLWEQFLKLKLDPELYKRVLIVLSDKVMPHLLRPLLLTDFLMNSYAVGGPISILSLNGVFTLMTKHNLEFPDFYKKLYQLFQVSDETLGLCLESCPVLGSILIFFPRLLVTPTEQLKKSFL